MSPSADPPAPPTGVIHDIGYRRYDGERLGQTAILRSLFVTSLRHAYGLGRSGKAKVLPFVLLGFSLVPALVVVAVMVLTPIKTPLFPYYAYAVNIEVLVCIFAAAQAPVLFSRDLRYGSITLYLSRPLTAVTYSLTRWAALVTALSLYLLAPVLLMYVGALLAELDFTEQTSDFLRTAVLLVLLAAMVGGLTGAIGSWSTRRGFAVVGSLGTLLVGHGIVVALQAIALGESAERVGQFIGLLAPYSLYVGLGKAWFGGLYEATPTPPEGPSMAVAYVAMGLLVALGGLAAIVWRHHRLARS